MAGSGSSTFGNGSFDGAGGAFAGSSSFYDGGTSFTVSGGVGSVSWTMAEIVECSGALARLAQLMQPLIDRLASERRWLGTAAAGTFNYPGDAVDAMVLAEWRCGAVSSRIENLARKASQAAANYAAAEANNANAAALAARLAALGQGLRAWRAGPLAPVTAGLDVLDWLGEAKRRGLRDAAEYALNNGGAYAAGTLGPGMVILYLLAQLRGRDTEPAGSVPAFMLRKSLDRAGMVRPGTLSVRPVPAQEWSPATVSHFPPGHADSLDGQPWTMDATFESMLGGSNDAYGYPPGSVGVVRIQRPDGTSAWVVHLPGTEDWSTLDSSNPFDMEGNLEGLTAARQEEFAQQEVLVQELIKEALQSAGAQPGEEVVLTGHSGGGIHAAAAAASPAFLADVNVKMIVIAGSPARNMAVGNGITVLELENEDDIVTAADFGPTAPSKNWVTVTSHRPSVPGGAVEVVGQAHSLDNYMVDAAELDGSSDPALQASQETLRNILGVSAGGAAAMAGTKWVYQGRDNNRPSAKPGPPPVKGKDFTPGAR